MENLAIITLKQSDYNLIMGQFPLLDIVPISIKILADDTLIKDEQMYKELHKKYIKARNDFEDYKFKMTTNK